MFKRIFTIVLSTIIMFTSTEVPTYAKEQADIVDEQESLISTLDNENDKLSKSTQNADGIERTVISNAESNIKYEVDVNADRTRIVLYKYTDVKGTETGELVDTMVFDGNSGQEPGVRHAYSSKTYTQLKTKNGNKYWYATGKSGSDLKHVKIGCVASYKVANNSNTSALIDSYKSHIVKSNNYVNQSTFYSSLAGAIALGSMAAELISEGLATGEQNCKSNGNMISTSRLKHES